LEDGRLLELAADAGVGNLRFGQQREIDRLAEERGARIRACLAGDDVHHRRLACAVGSDDAAQLAVVDRQREIVQRLEAVEADGDAVEIKDRTMSRVHAAAGDGHPRLGNALGPTVGAWQPVHEVRPFDPRRRTSPMTPDGRNNVTTTNSSPRKKSQISGNACVNQLLAPFTRNAPAMGPTSVPRPPTAVQIAISIEFAGDISPGLMIPTCGTYSAPAMPQITADNVHTKSL